MADDTPTDAPPSLYRREVIDLSPHGPAILHYPWPISAADRDDLIARLQLVIARLSKWTPS